MRVKDLQMCPVIHMLQVSKTHTKTKEDILKEINVLEIKADVYSNTDWDAYLRVTEQLKNLDMILLDMYNQENETFLQNHSA